MRYLRGLGWAAIAAAPILLGTLALLASRPDLPPELTTHAMLASWVAGSLAFAASLLASRGGAATKRAALSRVPIAMSAIVVIGFLGFLVWLSSSTAVRLEESEREELVVREGRLTHPTLGFSMSPLELERAPDVEREMSARGGETWARAHRLWAWRAEDTEIVLDLSRTTRADRVALENGIDAIAGPLDDPRIRRDGLTAAIEADLPGGGTAIARIALLEHRGRAYRAAITIVTGDADRWRAWLAEAQLRTR
jgi:hypothetical protein